MELFLHVAEDALLDTLKMLPFLFGTYLLMEYLEHRASRQMERLLAGSHRLGPVVGAALGLVPQCGFSVVAANLYSGGLITMGTLIAVFIATSDEAIPVLLSQPGSWGLIGRLLAVKLVLGVLAGFLVDLLFRRAPAQASGEEHGHAGHEHCEEGILRPALGHTVQIFFFVLLANLLLGGAVELLGQERLGVLLLGNSIFQPVVAALVGLIPNCAASVLLTSLYLEGTLSFGALVAGLSTGAGVGLMVLLRTNHKPKENLTVVGLLAAIGAVAGMAVQLVAG